MSYWQIATGSEGRDYADYLLKYGIALVGGKKYIKRICQVQPGDVVILKSGIKKIVAAGHATERNGVCSEKRESRDFDGWDLGGYCYVDWHIPPEPIAVTGLRIGTISGVKEDSSPTNQADRIIATYDVQKCYDPEPCIQKIDDETILNFLIGEGFRPGEAEDLTGAFSRIRRLARYYIDQPRDQPWENIREHETRTFLVIPLLLALGWAEQQIKIEYPVGRKKADIVCFSRPYFQPDKQCEIVVETKDFKTGLDDALDQAIEYAEILGSNIVVLTNGYCYKIYGRDDPNGEFMPHAYLNIFSPTDRYPRDDTIEGALEVFRLLLPQMSNRSIF